MSSIYLTFDTPPSTSSTATATSACGSADGSIAITNASATNIDIYSSTGLSTTLGISGQTNISNLSSGTYYINSLDPNGCKSVETVHINDGNFNVGDVISSETCAGDNTGLIDLTVTGGSIGNVNNVFWSNGITTEDMTGHAGEYSVEMHTDMNCNYYSTYTIPSNDIKFSLGNVFQGDCTGSSNGGANITVTGGTGTLSYEWIENSTSAVVGTMQNLSGANPGVHTCIITDANSCSKSQEVTIDATVDVFVTTKSVTPANCNQPNGSIDMNINIGPITFWQWSNGATTEDLINVPAGDYTLEYQGPSGCSSYKTITVPTTKPYQPSICLLTVDTSLTYNTIIWEKDPSFVVDGWHVYRETTIYGQFERVATIPYTDDAMYIDNASSPTDRSWRYYITSFNGCEESYPSFIHKTIHTVAFPNNSGLGGFDIVWDNYEGVNYSSVSLLKYSTALGWEEIQNITSPYNDQTPGLDYMVQFNLAQPCNPGKAIDHNSSRSNRSNGVYLPGDETGLTVIENEEGKVMMYPNPASTILNVYIENIDKYDYFTIIDLQGNIIYKQNLTENYNSIATNNFASGVYFVKIYSDSNVITEKIIKK